MRQASVQRACCRENWVPLKDISKSWLGVPVSMLLFRSSLFAAAVGAKTRLSWVGDPELVVSASEEGSLDADTQGMARDDSLIQDPPATLTVDFQPPEWGTIHFGGL